MVLIYYSYENSQSLKSSNSTSELKLVNNSYINTHNVTSNTTSNNSFGNSEWDCSITTRSSNSNKTIPLLIYHQNVRGLRNKIDELSMLCLLIFPMYFVLLNTTLVMMK